MLMRYRGKQREKSGRAVMTAAREPANIVLLTTIKGHMSAVETFLSTLDANDPLTACESALAELRSASLAQDEFNRAISHDLRNTLTMISGQAQLLGRAVANGTLDPARVQTAVDRIEQAVDHTATIIRRLSDP